MSLYGRIFAGVYDRMMQSSEDAGLRDRRRALVARADGRVLEIGAGTGLNLPLYPEGAFSELVLTEPEEPMARRLEERLEALSMAARVVRSPAEDLPFDAASFDTVVSTLVLCTVGDQDAALREARRVLKDDGRLLFMEHVRSDDPARAKSQDRWHGPWKASGTAATATGRRFQRSRRVASGSSTSSTAPCPRRRRSSVRSPSAWPFRTEVYLGDSSWPSWSSSSSGVTNNSSSPASSDRSLSGVWMVLSRRMATSTTSSGHGTSLTR